MLEKSYGTAGNDFSKPFGQLFSCGEVWRTRDFRIGNAGKEGFGNLLPNRLSMEIGVQYMVFPRRKSMLKPGRDGAKVAHFVDLNNCIMIIFVKARKMARAERRPEPRRRFLPA